MIWKKSHVINSNFAILSLKKKTKQEKTITIYLNRLIQIFLLQQIYICSGYLPLIDDIWVSKSLYDLYIVILLFFQAIFYFRRQHFNNIFFSTSNPE